MSEESNETNPGEEHMSSGIPRWTPDFDVKRLDIQTVLREAMAQKKSAYKVLKAAGYPVAKFMSNEVLEFKAAADGSELATVTVTASSDATDLSGDEFGESAINQMEAAVRGMSVFLNHSYNLPEDLFGTVEDAHLVRRTVTNNVTGETREILCLDLDIRPVTEEENPRGVRVYNMIRKGKRKLGSSVTVLVLKTKNLSNGRRQITDVLILEDSIVGIPCNQTAWAHTAKSIEVSETSMSTTNNDTVAADNASQTPVEEALTALIEADEANAKGMFADALTERQSSIYLVWDVFWTCFYKLQRAAESGEEMGFDANTAAESLVNETAAALLSAVQSALADPDLTNGWEMYAAQLETLSGVIQKSGARNSKLDQTTIEKIHALSLELGAKCETKEADGGDAAQKQASVTSAALADATSKAATLEAEKQTLIEEKAALQTQLSETQEEQGILEATCIGMLAVLKAYSRERLPRAGHTGSVSHSR
jgi:hypothetical protein